MNNTNHNHNNYYNGTAYNTSSSDGQMLSVMNEYNHLNNSYNNNSAVIERFHMRQNQRIHQQRKVVSLDGIQSGVPTLTTSTLTPTTLRNIEQTFIELTTDPNGFAPYQACFVPPPAPFVNFVDNSNDNNSMGASSESGSQGSWHTPSIHEDNSVTTDNSSPGTSINLNSGSPNVTLQAKGSTMGSSPATSTKKNTGGRRPVKPANLSPEEEEKRKIRRERNKLAAARCRKRRVDQTNELQEKVDKLEKEKEALQREIEHYYSQKSELKFALDAHRSHCRLHHNGISTTTASTLCSDNIMIEQRRATSPIDIKPIILPETFNNKLIKDEPIDTSVDSFDDGPPSPKRIMLSSTLTLPNVATLSTTIAATAQMLNTPTITTSPPPPTSTFTSSKQSVIGKARPSSLNVPVGLKPSQSLNNKMVNELGVPISTPSSGVMFNFDSLMDGGTGLTPVSGPLMPTCSSHSNKHPLELTTPTSEPSKLVSL